jgi:hypothetical protein
MKDRDLILVFCMWISSFRRNICWGGYLLCIVYFWWLCQKSGGHSCVGSYLGLLICSTGLHGRFWILLVFQRTCMFCLYFFSCFSLFSFARSKTSSLSSSSDSLSSLWTSLLEKLSTALYLFIFGGTRIWTQGFSLFINHLNHTP